MNRKPTKQSRGPNADEKKFQCWAKLQNCVVCDNWPCYLDHIYGSTKKVYLDDNVTRVHIGHWSVLPLCEEHDRIKTQGSRKAFIEKCDNPERYLIDLFDRSPKKPPWQVAKAF